MKTAMIRSLVDDVLGSLPKPLTEHVIDDVFHAIEKKPEWWRIYDENVKGLGKTVTNTWLGHWVATAFGKKGIVQVPSRRNSLTLTYSLLAVCRTFLP